jgi:phospholipid-binding lipoprotein MlaA
VIQRRSARRGFAAGLAGLLLAGAAAAQPPAGDEPADSSVTSDPLEGFNRGVFWFNDKLDHFMVRPAAIGWDALFPDSFERSVGNLLDNAGFPVVFLNDLLQAKPKAAGITLGRFLINSTLGLGGLFDPAAAHFGLAERKEDFGQTLGVWGVPRGPYLVLPILGPSNPRDAAGLVVDSAARVWPFFAPFYVSYAVGGTTAVNTRSRMAEEIDAAREAAFDYYAFVRNAYVQYRDEQVRDQEEDEEDAEEESDDDLYYPEEE